MTEGEGASLSREMVAASAPALVLVWPLAPVGRPLTYGVPGVLAGQVPPGMLVRVPLRGRTELAVVAGPGDAREVPEGGLKLVQGLAQPFPVVTEELLQLALWLGRYYAVDPGGVLEAILPAAVRRGMEARSRLYLRVAERPSAEELTKLCKRAPKQVAVMEFLMGQELREAFPRQVIMNRLKVSAPSLKALVNKGWLSETRLAEKREAYVDELGEVERVHEEAFELTEEQAAAVEDISASLEAKAFRAHLLHGVTGSGKTEVYLRLAMEVLERGGSVLFLVPEVALTPQTVGLLRTRLESLGEGRAVVLHSGLSEGERFDAWAACATGEAKVAVGARSAVFAPLQQLQLVIVDEEHEPAYKQEDTPRYHGRDVAVMRARLAGATVVLGSATPSLESLHNVQREKYRLNRLSKRVDDRQLPRIHVVDMRGEILAVKGPTLFSRTLTDKLHERLAAGEQSVLFLNRRGFNSRVLCPACGHVEVCDHCSVTLTYHRVDDILRCHLCGMERTPPERCPACRSKEITRRGSGTQRIEATVASLLPEAKVVRLDADTMQRKHLFRSILADFRAGRIDILVGTQMIAKGLDFPNVTLAGMVDADLSMHLPDFRAAERTFQLLVQVSGRSGRGKRAGEVVIQTFTPHADPIQFARRQDFEGFLDEELERRREFGYPPYRHLIHHSFRGPNEDKVRFYAEAFAKEAEEKVGQLAEIRGPAPAPVERIKDHWRYQLWYFTTQVGKVVPVLRELRRSFPWDKDVIEVLDVDAVHLI